MQLFWSFTLFNLSLLLLLIFDHCSIVLGPIPAKVEVEHSYFTDTRFVGPGFLKPSCNITSTWSQTWKLWLIQPPNSLLSHISICTEAWFQDFKIHCNPLFCQKTEIFCWVKGAKDQTFGLNLSYEKTKAASAGFVLWLPITIFTTFSRSYKYLHNSYE